ncbi:hypothetical protein DFJ73DRAFT_832720, partial [Zopfochytrium polystomum]
GRGGIGAGGWCGTGCAGTGRRGRAATIVDRLLRDGRDRDVAGSVLPLLLVALAVHGVGSAPGREARVGSSLRCRSPWPEMRRGRRSPGRSVYLAAQVVRHDPRGRTRAEERHERLGRVMRQLVHQAHMVHLRIRVPSTADAQVARDREPPRQLRRAGERV